MTFQTTFKLSTRSKGVHLVTKEVQQALGDGLKDCKAGMLFLSIKHTSAALTLNENYDPDVRVESVFSLHFFPLWPIARVRDWGKEGWSGKSQRERKKEAWFLSSLPYILLLLLFSMDMALDKVVPESLPWKHVDEGPDDSV
jgi:thiamine phosphate synthase YjbQ (UPF0047 family)